MRMQRQRAAERQRQRQRHEGQPQQWPWSLLAGASDCGRILHSTPQVWVPFGPRAIRLSPKGSQLGSPGSWQAPASTGCLAAAARSPQSCWRQYGEASRRSCRPWTRIPLPSSRWGCHQACWAHRELAGGLSCCRRRRSGRLPPPLPELPVPAIPHAVCCPAGSCEPCYSSCRSKR